ncbi:MAG: hypothetical protein MUE82_04940, partial [Chloroflexi bacterium]|nr:hypothetical protein [Chloroflexota bacterium]
WAGVQLGDNWEQIRHALEPFDLVIAIGVVGMLVVLLLWRLGWPGFGRLRKGSPDAGVVPVDPETADDDGRAP